MAVLAAQAVAVPAASATLLSPEVDADECKNIKGRKKCYGGSSESYCAVDYYDPYNGGGVDTAECLFKCAANSVIVVLLWAYDSDAGSSASAECSKLAKCAQDARTCTAAARTVAGKIGECFGYADETWESGFFLYCEDVGAQTGEFCKNLSQYVAALKKVCWAIPGGSEEVGAATSRGGVGL